MIYYQINILIIAIIVGVAAKTLLWTNTKC